MMTLRGFLRSRPLWLVVGIFALMVAARQAGLNEQLLLEFLRNNRLWLLQQVQAHPVPAALGYIVVYCAVTAFSLPLAAVLTLAGGFLFGAFLGTLLTVIGATSGATLVFIFARRIMGEEVLDRFGDAAGRLAKAIRRDAVIYLLVIRLVPLFPFVLVNLASAFVGVSRKIFVLTTFFGIIPGTFVFSLAGAGLGKVLDSSDPVSLKSVLTPEIIAGLVGMAALSLASIPIRRWLDAREKRQG